MKYIYINISIIAIVITLKAQYMSPFVKATESGWYPPFLQPVLDSIKSQGRHLKILDLGTGTGKLPELLIRQDGSYFITGIDIDSAFIKNAKDRVKHPHVTFDFQKTHTKLDFADASFDVVTICSVLFLIDESTRKLFCSESLRILKPGGKLIVLTPSGKKSRLTAFSEIWTFPYSKYNWTYFIWKTLTSRGGQKWQKEKWLENYANLNTLSYQKAFTFNDNACIEIIENKY